MGQTEEVKYKVGKIVMFRFVVFLSKYWKYLAHISLYPAHHHLFTIVLQFPIFLE